MRLERRWSPSSDYVLILKDNHEEEEGSLPVNHGLEGNLYSWRAAQVLSGIVESS
jgi:hypothetical protein